MSDFVDLHTHSTASDGTYTPSELVIYARSKGLAALALTDHDTVAGIEEALHQSQQSGIELIPGIEMSSIVDGCDVHIVGLFIDHASVALHDSIQKMQQTRAKRNRLMIDKLQKAGIDISFDDFIEYKDRLISRGHIAQILIQRGYASDLRDALNRYMVPDTVGYVQRESLSGKECIDAIHQANGLAIIAHIHLIDPNNWPHIKLICEELIQDGADGIETRYCEYDELWEARAMALKQKHGLLASGGSDFHGSIKANLDLGIGYGNLQVPYDYLAAMKEKLGR